MKENSGSNREEIEQERRERFWSKVKNMSDHRSMV